MVKHVYGGKPPLFLSLSHMIGVVMMHWHALLLFYIDTFSASFIMCFPTVWDRCVDESCAVCGVSSLLDFRSGGEGRCVCARSVTVNKSSLELTVGRKLSGWETHTCTHTHRL